MRFLDWIDRGIRGIGVVTAWLTVVSIAAYGALQMLDRTLRRKPTAPTLTIAPTDWERLARGLPVFEDRLFQMLRLNRDTGSETDLDLDRLIGEVGADKAEQIVASALGREIARLLKMPEEKVLPSSTLGELGFDSLMGMQLRLTVEERLGTALPENILSEQLTLARLARALVERRSTAVETGQGIAQAMAESHLTESEIPDELKNKIIHSALRGQS